MTRTRVLPISSLLLANFLSLIGNEFSRIAVPWFVLMITGSPMATAGILIAGQLPNMMAGLFSGLLIDRYSARMTSLFCDAVNVIAIALIPLCYAVDMLSMALLAVLVFASQIIDVPGETAKQVMVSELIDRDHLPRERVNGLYSLTSTVADLFGPALAGILLALLGVLSLLWIDALTFLLAAMLILVGVPAASIRKSSERPPAVAKLWQDWRWLLSDSLLRRLAVFDLLLNTVAVAVLSLTLPVLAQRMGDATMWLGFWFSAFAVGTTATAMVYTAIGHRFPEGMILRLTPLGQVVGLGAVLASVYLESKSGIAIGLAFYGLNLGFGSMVDATLLQKSVPETRRGTVFAAFSSLRYAGVPLGLLLAGGLLSGGYFAALFMVFAGLLMIASLLWWRVDLGKWAESR